MASAAFTTAPSASMIAATMSPSVSTTCSSENGNPFTLQYDQYRSIITSTASPTRAGSSSESAGMRADPLEQPTEAAAGGEPCPHTGDGQLFVAVRGLAPHEDERPVVVEHPQVDPHELVRALACPTLRQRVDLVERAIRGFERLLAEREQQVALRREVRVERGTRHAGGVGDVVDPEPVVALREEHVAGGVHEQRGRALRHADPRWVPGLAISPRSRNVSWASRSCASS